LASRSEKPPASPVVNFIVLTTNLLVAQYLVAVSNFMLATMAALVVGKAVLVANKIPLLRSYDRAPLIQPILFKTAFYIRSSFLGKAGWPQRLDNPRLPFAPALGAGVESCRRSVVTA